MKYKELYEQMDEIAEIRLQAMRVCPLECGFHVNGNATHGWVIRKRIREHLRDEHGLVFTEEEVA